MATLYTKLRSVPKKYRNKRIYQGDRTVTVGTSQGSDASTPGYTAGTGLDLTGNEFSISDDGVDTTQLANSAVTNAKINPLAVDSGKLSSGAVTTAKISNDNVTADKIQNFIFSGVNNHNSTLTQNTNTSWLLVTTRTLLSNRYAVGAKIIVDAILRAEGADCYGGFVGSIDTDDLHNSSTPAFATAELTNGVDMVVMRLELWVISSTKIAYSFAYKEDAADGWQGHISGIQTLSAGVMPGDSISIGILIRDDSGSNNCYYEHGSMQIFRNCATA